MATLYNQADSNIRKTWFLISGFLVFIILLGWLFSRYFQSPAILYLAVIFSVLTSFSSYWFSDKIVLSMTRSQPIKEEDNRELFHVVENLCITAGVKMPKIFIMPEAQPNAFATGRNEEHAVVVVTQGLLQKLNKNELEGVIAHELSHIKNKDMLLQTVVVVLAGIVAMLSNFFLRISFYGRSSDDNNRAGALLALLGLVAAILAPIAATLIQLAISRKREFLADASGALLTRYPEGLANALEKISTDPTPMRAASNSTAHLFISSPFKGRKGNSWLVKLFMTHPPIEERLAALRGMDIK
ncbi:zinc metalloprotease HtpX [bacterium (Candidatus Gribaldobacteria) CG02_land_8_20_14_3_00_41_15]|uniref:Protease HtpX homolog n=2 Tax=Candidatus Gribaldobacteria TaxID=2798536 RepID=A0A2H0UVZ4_9BACT|nr:MAG: zinc metalloprotease HtpX [Parcubacteria group bacterium CG1_02_41_26]PIR91001.1 MAG: zinc metalloprotease HtpX [bacterium (Candidatus Gribaldobacteria) CG10_big_fil_rev_8_21_14_0_10_41_12]PIV47409.1 MAG: zinc metalloprotease HtpX [bacterium (Candidatus Gribaldobacteria) CG02_land_8_20_14_3_00_41_15]